MKNKEPVLLATWIMAPDGTMLPSFYRHDYRNHVTVDETKLVHKEELKEPEDTVSEEWIEWFKDAVPQVISSRESMVDGGTEPFGRRGGIYTEMSVYDTDPFEVIRRFVCRGGRGKEGDEPLTWVPLFRINNSWLQNIIIYEEENNPKSIYLSFYIKEFEYRRENNIFIPE